MSELHPDLTPSQPPELTHELSQPEVDRIQDAVHQRLVGMDNILYAGIGQSLDAMETADIVTDALRDTLTADPDATAMISQYRGPLSELSRHAGRMHQHQTGHNYPDSYLGLEPSYEDAMRSLGGVKAKVLDRRWDGTYGRSDADAITAYARKSIATEAASALSSIAQERGRITISEETQARLSTLLGTDKEA